MKGRDIWLTPHGHNGWPSGFPRSWHPLSRTTSGSRLAHVTITDARVTNDLHEATLYYTVMGESIDSPPDYAEAAAGPGQSHRSPAVQGRCGDRCPVHPTLTFVRDSVPDAARHMEELVARARANDLAVAQQAAAAQPAGEADPYRHDDEDGRTE